jgi:hypothetical protein
MTDIQMTRQRGKLRVLLLLWLLLSMREDISGLDLTVALGQIGMSDNEFQGTVVSAVVFIPTQTVPLDSAQAVGDVTRISIS